MKIHNGEKPYKCIKCYTKKHTGEKQYNLRLWRLPYAAIIWVMCRKDMLSMSRVTDLSGRQFRSAIIIFHVIIVLRIYFRLVHLP